MESVRGIENPGMMGEMGKIIGFYRLYRQTAEEEWEEKAEVLLDEVMENCSLELPVTYGDGLCGVGVGIEYLLQEGFVEGDAGWTPLELYVTDSYQMGTDRFNVVHPSGSLEVESVRILIEPQKGKSIGVSEIRFE